MLDSGAKYFILLLWAGPNDFRNFCNFFTLLFTYLHILVCNYLFMIMIYYKKQHKMCL